MIKEMTLTFSSESELIFFWLHWLSLCDQQNQEATQTALVYTISHGAARWNTTSHSFSNEETRRRRGTVGRRGGGEKKCKRFPTLCKSPAATAGQWPIMSSCSHDKFDAMHPQGWKLSLAKMPDKNTIMEANVSDYNIITNHKLFFLYLTGIC